MQIASAASSFVVNDDRDAASEPGSTFQVTMAQMAVYMGKVNFSHLRESETFILQASSSMTVSRCSLMFKEVAQEFYLGFMTEYPEEGAEHET